MELQQFEQIIGYTFKNIDLLKTALTHSSYANEKKQPGITSNERLEFLGDSVLSLVISHSIFSDYPNLPEGELTKLRSIIVCETTLKEIANEIQLGSFLLLGKGEEISGGRNRASILADAFEAVAGAIYIDGGFEKASQFILQNTKHLIDTYAHGKVISDFKTKLQEILQKHGDVKIIYDIMKIEGPDHDRVFSVRVSCDNKTLGIGSGKSKKEAEQAAAQKAIDFLGKKE
jgi:ribonuclease-3